MSSPGRKPGEELIILGVWKKLVQYTHAVAWIYGPKQIIPRIPDGSQMPGRNISGYAEQTEGFHNDDLLKDNACPHCILSHITFHIPPIIVEMLKCEMWKVEDGRWNVEEWYLCPDGFSEKTNTDREYRRSAIGRALSDTGADHDQPAHR